MCTPFNIFVKNIAANKEETKLSYKLMIVMSFLDLKDLISVSLVSKYLEIQTQFFWPLWKKKCNDYFCSPFANYRDAFNKETYIDKPLIKLEEPINPEFYEMKPDLCSLNTWKNLFKYGWIIKREWESSSITDFSIDHIDESFQNIHTLKDDLYSNLKHSPPYSNIRPVYPLYENEVNTSLQRYLYDLLSKENNTYQMNLTSNQYTYQLGNKPFWGLFLNIKSIHSEITTNSDETAKFYAILAYKEISIKKDDSLISILMSKIYQTIKHYCYLSKKYIEEIVNPEEMLKEYVIRYKNYTETALNLDDKYFNINLILNALASMISGYPIPRYSLLRLFMLTWNNNCLTPLKELLGQNLHLVLQNKLDRDIGNLTSKSKDNLQFNDLSIEKINSSFFSNTEDFQNNFYKPQTYDLMDCDEEEEEEEKYDDLPQYSLLSQFFSIINDTFCNEFNIFQINISDIAINQTYQYFVEILIQEIQLSLERHFNQMSNEIKSDRIFQVICKIVSHFKGTSKFMEQFIPKTKLFIMKAVSYSLKDILIHKREGENNDVIMQDNTSISGSTFDCTNSSHYGDQSNTSKIRNKKPSNPYDQCNNKVNNWFLEEEQEILKSDKKTIRGLCKNSLIYPYNKEKAFVWNPSVEITEQIYPKTFYRQWII